MWLIRPWSLLLALVFIAPLTLAEDTVMSTRQQCVEYGVYQDANENWIECSDNGSAQNEEEVYVDEPYVEETYVEPPYVEETYIEDTYTEEPYVEQPYVEESYTD
jgi:hypothetical protein